MTVGCVAGDEESYQVFGDLFNPVIKDRHNGYKETDMHKTDLDPSHLKVLNFILVYPVASLCVFLKLMEQSKKSSVTISLPL